jgi:hypothetical protein
MCSASAAMRARFLSRRAENSELRRTEQFVAGTEQNINKRGRKRQATALPMPLQFREDYDLIADPGITNYVILFRFGEMVKSYFINTCFLKFVIQCLPPELANATSMGIFVHTRRGLAKSFAFLFPRLPYPQPLVHLRHFLDGEEGR